MSALTDDQRDLALIREAASGTPCLNPRDAGDIAAWILCAASRIASLQRKQEETSALLAELFRYLDTVEESDDGREFHPVHFSCCRAMWIEDLDRIFGELKQRATKPTEGGAS